MNSLKRFLSIGAAILIMTPLACRAWTPGLQEAAQAVATGVATPEQRMLVHYGNHELQLLAQEGRITNAAYTTCQDEFFRLNEGFADQAVRETGFKAKISDRKFNPGTDTDVNILGRGGKKVTLEDVKRIEDNYQRITRQYFKNQGLTPPRQPISADTDFMPHPAHTDPDEFQKIVKYINANGGTAYTDPRAASAQAKLSGSQPIKIDEASSFSSTMKEFADAKIAKADLLRNQARTLRQTDPGQAELLEAQARQYDFQASKYHDRIDTMNNQLRRQNGLPEKPRSGVGMDRAVDDIAQYGRNPFTGKDAGAVHNLHQSKLQSATDDMIDTLIDLAKKDPAGAADLSKALAREVNSLPNNRAGQAIERIDDALRGARGIDPEFVRGVVAEARALKQAASAATKWQSFKETLKNVSGFNQMTKFTAVMTVGGALLIGHQGVSVALTDVEATDTFWDFVRKCYYHAAWEGTGIGPAFDEAQRNEIESYMKAFEAGQEPSMTKHIVFTMLKTGVYMGRDAIIGVLYLPSAVWEYFTQEKELEAKAALQNELARVMRKMILDRKNYEQAMANMRKMGLHDEDAKLYLDCLCRGCGGMQGGLFNPAFDTESGHGPCQCNGPLTIWKTPLPVHDTKAQHNCFNEVTHMRYLEAQDIFDKWHKRLIDENAQSVEKAFKAIEERIKNHAAQESERVARDLADEFDAIKDMLYLEDADFVRGTLGPYLENHAFKALERGDIRGAVDDIDRILNKVGTRDPQQAYDLRQRKAQYGKWAEKWAETKRARFPEINAMLRRNQVHKAAWEIENLEYQMLKDPSRPLPPAIQDADFVALKKRVAELGQRYNQSMNQMWREVTALEKARDRRAAIGMMQSALGAWVHPDDQANALKAQIAYDQGEVSRAEAKKSQGWQREQAGDSRNAITLYTESLAIQRDDALDARLRALRVRPIVPPPSPAPSPAKGGAVVPITPVPWPQPTPPTPAQPAPIPVAPPRPAGPTPLVHIGCYADRDQRDLDALSNIWVGDAATCVRHCADKGFRYGAVQAGSQCFCGNTYGRYGQSSACVECRGVPGQFCGGTWANSVYHAGEWPPVSATLPQQPSPTPAAPPKATPPAVPVHLGCFADREQRDLDALPNTWVGDANACIRRCAEKGFNLAGIQAGSHCFCGNSHGRYGKSSACVECRGAPGQFCGGTWANSIYRTGR